VHTGVAWEVWTCFFSGTVYAFKTNKPSAAAIERLLGFPLFVRVQAMRSLAILLSLFVTLSGTAAFAQAPAGAKQRAEYNYYMGGAGSALRSARDYTSNYQTYTRTAQPVNPEIAKETADAVGEYIAKAEKHFAWMRKQAQASNDKEALTSLDSIDKNLAEAKKHHGSLCEHCAKETVAAKESMDCCKQIDSALAKAIDEHDKLMKRLNAKK
jgi:hypothetical protein